MALLSLLVSLFVGITLWGDSPGTAAAAVALVLAFVWYSVRQAIPRSLPTSPRLEPAPPRELRPETTFLIADLEALGFVALGGPHRANMQPAPLVLPFVHRELGVLAAVYDLDTPQERTVLDFVTPFVDGALLGTANAREAGCLPVPEHRFLQTRHGATATELLAAHHEGIAALRAAGLRSASTAGVTLASFLDAVTACLRAQREAFDRAPARTTTLALLRTLLPLDPHRRPLAEQLAARGRLRELAAASSTD